VTWATIALLAASLFVLGTPVRYQQLTTVSPQAITIVGQLRPQDAALLAQAGFSVNAYAGYFTGLEAVATLVVLASASLIFAGRSDDWMAWYVSFFMISSTTALPTVTALETTRPLWGAVILALRAAFGASLIPLFYLFPNGRFLPAFTRWLAGIWWLYTALWFIFPAIRPPIAFGRGLMAGELPIAIWMQVWLLSGVLAQIWRYRRVSTPAQRQRTKWAVFGFAIFLVCFVTGVGLLTYSWITPSGLLYVASRLGGPTLILVGFMAVALTIALAALRYHLWDIDIIIRRTLVYSALSSLLALVYFISIVVLQGMFATFGGQRAEWVTVLSTLAIAALFLPLRRRVQDFIDKRFYRKKYDAQKVLAAFATTCRDETDLDKLTARLVEVVDETMQPESVSLWLKETGRKRGVNRDDR
jgi:hypothetical protein